MMLHRIVRVAQNFDNFSDLPSSTQKYLLTKNAHVIFSLQEAVFFQKKRQGVDQILSSLGTNDLQSAHMILSATNKKHATLTHMDYKGFNTIRDRPDSSEEETRFDLLLETVGDRMSVNQNLVILFSHILLFSSDYPEVYILHKGSATARKIVQIERTLIEMLQRYIHVKFSHEHAEDVYNGMMNCKKDLQELTRIKNNRQTSASEGILDPITIA